jgi:hypothetical protein
MVVVATTAPFCGVAGVGRGRGGKGSEHRRTAEGGNQGGCVVHQSDTPFLFVCVCASFFVRPMQSSTSTRIL